MERPKGMFLTLIFLPPFPSVKISSRLVYPLFEWLLWKLFMKHLAIQEVNTLEKLMSKFLDEFKWCPAKEDRTSDDSGGNIHW